MKLNNYSLILLALATTIFVSCKDENVDEHHFDNKLYVTSQPVCDDLLIQDGVTETSREISVRTAIPVDKDVQITFEARPEIAAKYNLIYGDNATALDAGYYEIPEKSTVIKAGATTGDPVIVNFKATNELDGNKRYVLPVSIANVTHLDFLESTRTVYFVFKGAALINVVANIARMSFPVNWVNTASVRNMSVITVEALVRSSDWEAGRGNAISTIFGVEGKFLIRVGDSDRPRNQVQFAIPGGNFPAKNAAPALPVNEWVHIAIVYDTNTGERIYYQNGKVVASDKAASQKFSLWGNMEGCYVGYSFNDERWLPGEISELRVWNVQRTAQEIANNMYRVEPHSEGLVAYWKFDEGNGNTIHDYTGYGNNLTGSATPKWIPVELPAKN